MQTFLPFPDFLDSANALDKKRCWKQVIETKQIIDCLEGKTAGWKNHPAVKMWEGHIPLLKYYFNTFLLVAKNNHKINTKYKYNDCLGIQNQYLYPWWLGKKKFHRAMRARLIEKDRAFYLPLFPKDKGFNNGKYFWPVMESKTFRII